MRIETAKVKTVSSDKPSLQIQLVDAHSGQVYLVVLRSNKSRRMGDILKNLDSFLKDVKSTHDDDGVDRLNYVWTIYILLAFALTLFAKNYVGEPLQCWVPKQFTGTWEAFSESYCFVENTYFVPMNDTNLPEASTREGKEMIYYQWVPFILSLMAFFFFVPRAIWRIFSSYGDLALADMMVAARKSAKTMEKCEKDMNLLAQRIVMRSRNPAAPSQMNYGSSLFNLYIVMKVAIWLNLILQFFFLNHFLGTGYLLWGFGILSDLLHGRHWQESGHFPRVAFCDLTVREMGNVNNWTVQCVLMVNMFNEKIFLFLWWWFAIVLCFTTVNLVSWLLDRFIPGRRRSFIHTLLKDSGLDRENGNDSYDRTERFYTEVLKDDGVLVLRLLDSNGGRMQSVELFKMLWNPTITPNGGICEVPEKTEEKVFEEQPEPRFKSIAEKSGLIDAPAALDDY